MERYVRKLAKSYKCQFLYTQTKEMSSIRLFQNETELTAIQTMFLQWLSIYHSLYSDIREDKEYINQEIIDDDMRTDAYLYYRTQISKKKISDKPKTGVLNNSGIPQIVFTRK